MLFFKTAAYGTCDSILSLSTRFLHKNLSRELIIWLNLFSIIKICTLFTTEENSSSLGSNRGVMWDLTTVVDFYENIQYIRNLSFFF